MAGVRGPAARAVLQLATWLVAGVALMAAVGALAIWIYAGPAQGVQTHQLRIPAGASQQIAAGANPLQLPATWELTSGDVLVIDNADTVTHTFGSWTIPAGVHLETVLRPNLGPVLCTLHPDGRITLDVRPARTDWGLARRAALLLGIPLGVVGWLVNRIRHALDDPAGRELAPGTAPEPPRDHTLTSATGGLR